MSYSKNEKYLLAALAGAKFTHIIDFMVMMPLGPQLMRIFNITAKEFGFLVASYTMSAGIAVLLSSFFIDRLPRRKAVLTAYFGFIVGTLACGLANSFFLLLMARMLTGIFGGILNALILSTVGDSFPIGKRAGAMGIVLSAFSSAAAFGVPFGIYIASIGHWNWPFLILVLVSIPVWFLLFYNLKTNDTKSTETSFVKVNPLSVITRVLKNPNQLTALGMSLTLVLSQFMIIPYISPYMVGNIGFKQIDLVYIYFIGGLCTLVSGPIIGRLADKYGHKKLFIIFAFTSIIPILLLTHLPMVAMPVALVVTSMFFIFISGRIIPSTTMVVSSAETRYRAGFVSINTSMQQFAAGTAAIISGLMVTETGNVNTGVNSISGYENIGWLAFALTIISIYLGSRLVPVKD